VGPAGPLTVGSGRVGRAARPPAGQPGRWRWQRPIGRAARPGRGAGPMTYVRHTHADRAGTSRSWRGSRGARLACEVTTWSPRGVRDRPQRGCGKIKARW